TIPSNAVDQLTGRVEGHASFVNLLGQSIKETSGTVTMDRGQLGVDLRVEHSDGVAGTIAGSMRLSMNDRAIDLTALTMGLGRAPWRLVAGANPATVRWDSDSVSVAPIAFAGGNGDQEIRISGDWRQDGNGTLHIVAGHVFLDALQAAFERPTRYGGVLDMDMTMRGTAERPLFAGQLTVTSGRVEGVAHQKWAPRWGSPERMSTLGARLAQSAGVWLTAKGKAPLALMDRSLPEQPLDVAITSSGINLGLIEGLTDLVRNVTGQLLIDVHAVGTSRDPHFTGAIGIDRAAFDVVPSGVKDKNGRIGLTLSSLRI